MVEAVPLLHRFHALPLLAPVVAVSCVSASNCWIAAGTGVVAASS